MTYNNTGSSTAGAWYQFIVFKNLMVAAQVDIHIYLLKMVRPDDIEMLGIRNNFLTFE
jgi:hypothetical protein